jgi:hypothetical protein
MVRSGRRHVQTTKIDEQTDMIMSTILSAPPAAQCVVRQSQVDSLVARLKRWWVAYIAWRIQQRAIAQLRSMNIVSSKTSGSPARKSSVPSWVSARAITYSAAATEPFSQEGTIS